ncbi:UNVERIFIED_CONTAM: hypothetical protein PYX00_007843 [Menopon gallinae]|uniref:Putative inositol monophosphatase 3 n=1 Tax=Menopon gallinae TaxID=328185 RepID=A0AAW2HL89_9NEOP
MNFGGNIRLNKFGICIIIGLVCFMFLYISSSNKTEIEKKRIVSLKKLLIAAIETAIKGGREVIDVYRESNLNERSKGKTKEGVDLPVTDADMRSNCAMYYSLVHTFPDIKVISEEVTSESGCRTLQSLELDQNNLKNGKDLGDEQVFSSSVTIWIDPLDATKEFTENLLQYVSTMVCVAVNGEPTIGVIHFPFAEEPMTVWGWVKRGVSPEIEKRVSAGDNNVVIVSKSHPGEVENVVRATLGDSYKIISAGGAGYKVLEVASKNVSAYIHTTVIKKWDICAGNAILNALGGQMTTLKNERIDYSSSASPKNEDGILATLSRHSDFIEKFKSFSSSKKLSN